MGLEDGRPPGAPSMILLRLAGAGNEKSLCEFRQECFFFLLLLLLAAFPFFYFLPHTVLLTKGGCGSSNINEEGLI